MTAAGAIAWIIVFPRVGTDLSAAMTRAGWARDDPGSAYIFSWYGGIHPASYSLLAPYLLAVIGTRLAMAAAAVAAAALLTVLLVRHGAPRPYLAALWVAVALWTELSAGRAAFTVALAPAAGCVIVAGSGLRNWARLPAAAALATVTGLIARSPPCSWGSWPPRSWAPAAGAKGWPSAWGREFRWG